MKAQYLPIMLQANANPNVIEQYNKALETVLAGHRSFFAFDKLREQMREELHAAAEAAGKEEVASTASK
jgi:hypothetical protein